MHLCHHRSPRYFVLLISTVLSTGAHADAQRNVFFGDTHLHSAFSADASLLGNKSATPDVSYRFAQGLPVLHPQHGGRVQLDRPLDFLAVSDHAETLGVIPAMVRGDERINHTEYSHTMVEHVKQGRPFSAFQMLLQRGRGDSLNPSLRAPEITAETWKIITDSADAHYIPGSFTSLVAWEWSSMPAAPTPWGGPGPNLHRVVLMEGSGELAQRFTPYSSDSSQRPEDLWAWLQKQADELNTDFVAIPHNPNIGAGAMFAKVDSDGNAIDADYAKARMRWEPVVESTQFKGDSETHPFLSPDDEFADYEQFILAGREVSPSDFIRGALRIGLELENEIGTNPYQFGQIGASDSHTGLATIDEDNFHGKWASQSTPQQLLHVSGANTGATMGAAGLAAVWADENTRESIFAAFKRKEVYATTGSRLQVRFFGGTQFKDKDARARNLAERGYEKGVTMGGVLERETVLESKRGAPGFLISASKDPEGANLDRIQIIKGWLNADGNSAERVYNIIASGDREIAADGSVEAVGDTVNRTSASYTNSIGVSQLSAVWYDPDYDENQKSVFYYARVLEIPTPRYTLIDSVAAGQQHPDFLPETVQERAYTSPIWVN